MIRHRSGALDDRQRQEASDLGNIRSGTDVPCGINPVLHLTASSGDAPESAGQLVAPRSPKVPAPSAPRALLRGTLTMKVWTAPGRFGDDCEISFFRETVLRC